MEPDYEGVAIVGLHGRFPGADSVEAFWDNLVAGRETVSFFDDSELAKAGLDVAALRREGAYVAARGVLRGADEFDAGFFGIHPKEAEVMDPQHRVFLETAWEALERAGYPPGRIRVPVAVYAGATHNTYYLQALHGRPDLRELVGAEQVMLGNEKDYLTTRVAYKLDLKGPAVSLNTACSSSLVAVVHATQALLTYQCDLALAGGVSVTVPQVRGYHYQEGNIASPDGHTRTFDVRAQGTCFGNGVGVVVLKRLADAMADGDTVYAVIKGAAMNNDGLQRASFGAPGVEGQSEVIALAQGIAGVEPDSIGYVEAHGTATPIGDPIEVAALTQAFRRSTTRKGFCGLGSVKSNVGHLDAAAGVTGLIKTALALHHRRLPPSLHFTAPNPKLLLEESPFFVNAELRDWPENAGTPRRAGVSSFGTGGTNAHVVLEEAPAEEASGPARSWQILLLSAKTPAALDAATARLAAHLGERAGENLADVAYTLQTGRSDFARRRAVVCRDLPDAVAQLTRGDAKRVLTGQQELKSPPVVFLFPGQGAQYAGMGAELYRHEPVFRAEVDRCAAILDPLLGLDLRRVLFPEPSEVEKAERELVQTRLTQPALFVVEYALARLWMSWGVRPAAMVGHSVGEYVAGCLAGVFPLEQALLLVARRARWVQEQPPGSMLAVRAAEADLRPLLGSDLDIAAINAPNLCVVSGPHAAVEALEKVLAEKGMAGRRLRTSHAFHSPMMDPVLPPFTELLRQSRLAPPEIPYISNVTGRWITPEQAVEPEYWARHVRQAVRFADCVAELASDPRRVLLEVGPGQTLSQLARQHPARQESQPVIASLTATGSDEMAGLLAAVGKLWLAGVDLDWKAHHGDARRRRVVLPTYPFERKRYWPEAPAAAARDVGSMPSVIGGSGDGRSVIAAAVERLSVGETPAASVTLSASGGAGVSSGVPESRREHLAALIRSALEELSGTALGAAEDSGFLELGLDSLLLTQAAGLFQRRFGVAVSFRQLMEELGTVGTLAAYLDAELPEGSFAPPGPAAADPAASVPSTAGGLASGERVVSAIAGGSSIEALLQQQLRLTSELLAAVQGRPAGSGVSPGLPGVRPTGTGTGTGVGAAAGKGKAEAPKVEQRAHGPFKPIDRGAAGGLSERQQKALEAFIARYTRKTAGSKRLAEGNRARLADPRSAAGFKQMWKEMVYPIHTERSDGSRVWDVDGNEYVDFVMGFGASLFGHRPPFVVEAVHRQLEAGFEIGPIQPLAGEVAGLVQELTGMERVAFCNTGSEAVLAAVRVARTVSGRDRIALFAGAYHGIGDEVLARPLVVNGEHRSAPIAPGIPGSATSQVMVLEYGRPESLEILRRCGHELAAVLVEPVQSRRLDLQPQEFLRELRRITEETGTALVFDEVVTGFRVHPGGAQVHFGVRADLATYGKVIGGGLPIGVVTGKARYMDALDGGAWRFGDASFPEVGVTFFAGTFVRHPLALAAARSVLLHLKQEGPELQARVAALAAGAADRLREVIRQLGAPLHVAQFSSLVSLTVAPEFKYGGLLYYHLRDRGIHIFENRAFIFTTAHGEADVDRLVRALEEGYREMADGGLVPEAPSPDRASGGVGASSDATAQRGLEAGLASPRVFPLTEAQKEIWLATQMDGAAASAFNESLTLRFDGPFDPDRFRRALGRVLERHPILLATFRADGTSQELPAKVSLEVGLEDLSGDEPETRTARWVDLVRRECSESPELDRGPALRCRIVRFAADRHQVLFTPHHIVCDGWSTAVVLEELGRFYSAEVKGVAPVLPPAPSFRDYALAESSKAESAEMARALAFWRERFAVPPTPVDLPLDRLRPSLRSYRSDTLRHEFPAALVQAIKRAAAQQRTTPVVYLMASLKVLLGRLSGQTDVVLGLPAAGQSYAGQPGLVGHCVNLLPIRATFESATPFREHLTAVKRAVLDAYDHQQCTFGMIVRHVSLPRIAGRLPLVEILFNVDRAGDGLAFEGLECSVERNRKLASNFDLFFNLSEGARTLTLACDYSTDILDAETVRRWVTYWENLLRNLTDNPEWAVGRVPMLEAAERQQLLARFQPAPLDYPKRQTFLDLFAARVATGADRVAVVAERQRLTYGELESRAEALSRRLRRWGVRRGTLVGVGLGRQTDLVVALLAVWKAGGAYLPLDPNYPGERIAFTLEDAGVPLLITERGLYDRWPPLRAHIVCLDDPTEEAPGTEMVGGESPGPEDLAYVIYTSGSTGRPKGVPIQHRSLVNFLTSMQREPGLGDKDVVLGLTTLSFDIAGLELWLPLMVGAQVALVPSDAAVDPLRLAEYIRRYEVTVMQATPATWRMLLEGGWTGDPRLRVLCGGEALSRELADQLLERSAELWNMYGPTETTVWSAVRRVRRGEPIGLGRPIANTQLYVLDERREPVPVGVQGELYIGGDGVSPGYLNRPELTAERFVPDVFGPEPGRRLYRTGDLVRAGADGELKFLGRTDSQVKIRGFRIELGEIEAALASHPGVRQVTAIVREDHPGDRRLVAYVVPAAGSEGLPQQLREQARRRLPEYMVPSAFVFLEALPLTPNRKVDRKALPPPSADGQSDGRELEPPATPTEEALARLWAEVLRVETVGRGGHFFELGGHSLLATQMLAKVGSTLGVALRLTALFEHPTLADFAALIDRNRAARVPSAVGDSGGATEEGLL